MAGEVSLTLLNKNGGKIFNTAVVHHLDDSTAFQQTSGIAAIDGGTGHNVLLPVRVHVTGTYFILVDGIAGETGTYTVFVHDEGQTFTPSPRGSKQSVSEPNGQDLPNFLTSTGYVQVNGDGATGRIANANDQDVFAVKLHRNTQYRIEVWGDDAQNGGTLADPKVTLRNHAFDKATNGGELEQIGLETWEQASRGGIHDNNSGSGKNAQVDVAPHWSQRTYYTPGRKPGRRHRHLHRLCHRDRQGQQARPDPDGPRRAAGPLLHPDLLGAGGGGLPVRHDHQGMDQARREPGPRRTGL